MLKKKLIWTISIIAFLLMASWITLGILRTRIHNVDYWLKLPLEVQKRCVVLEVERWGNLILSPDISKGIDPAISMDSVEVSLDAAVMFLAQMQDTTGRFNYWYDPYEDTYSPIYDDNFLRQAGTVYSISKVYAYTHDSLLLGVVNRGITYLQKFAVDVDDDKSYFYFRNKSKLGGTALPMMSMLQMREISGTKAYDSLLRRSANMLLHLQSVYGTGQYKSTYLYNGQYDYEEQSGWESNIYPGEAMLALALMYQAFGDEAYKSSIDSAIAFYANSYFSRRFAFMPWTITACYTMYIQTQEAHYLEYAFKLSDKLLRQQNLNLSRDVVGSFHPLPTVNTSCYMEGITDAIILADMVGDKERFERYNERALLALPWIMTLQVQQKDMVLDSLKEIAYGGLAHSDFNQQLRIDNTQHSLVYLLKMLRNRDYLMIKEK